MRKRDVVYVGGRKCYAKRNADGTFKDIQSYKRAQTQDMKHKSKNEKIKKLLKGIDERVKFIRKLI